METALLIAAAVTGTGLLALGASYAFWRYVWFWRNPPRTIPRGEHFLSPADGTVVYVKRAPPGEPIIVCKQGKPASINDIAREDLAQPKILIGIFMSPLGVHHNRAPISAVVAAKKQYAAEGRNVAMGSMHWRSVLRRLPIYAHSPHITQNNRAVTRFCGAYRGAEISCYVVQIGGASVHGIDVYPDVGQRVEQGQVFGMIRIGSQVDLILPDLAGLEVQVAPGDRVRAGETVLARNRGSTGKSTAQ
jgi:phosphatidylserine decarboxylase